MMERYVTDEQFGDLLLQIYETADVEGSDSAVALINELLKKNGE